MARSAERPSVAGRTAAGASSWISGVPELVWSPIAASILILASGGIGFATGYPLLFPSLGPSVFLHVAQPHLPSSRFYNTLVGHLIGMGAAMLAVWLIGADEDPSVLSANELHPRRIWASGLAILLAVLIQLRLRAMHPPAAATTLLISLGGFRVSGQDALVISIGVLFIAVLGEGLRRLRIPRSEQ